MKTLPYRIGVSGTSRGSTDVQLGRVVAFTIAGIAKAGSVIVHQGCCEGFDEQITIRLAGLREAGYSIRIIGHPPFNAKKLSRTALELSDHLVDPDEYLARDRAIVHSGRDLVMIAPFNYIPIPRGNGEWYTGKYALRAKHKRTLVIFPDGTFKNAKEVIARDRSPAAKLRTTGASVG